MKNLIFHLLLWIFMLIVAATFSACDKTESTPLTPITNEADLTDVLNDIFQDCQFPGFAVSVVQNNEVVYQQAFGQADIAQDRPFTNKTIQPIGSISKTFIGAALVKAMEQGYFTLETDINELLPYTLYNPKQPEAIIRVEHLVTHTSGLLDNAEDYLSAYYIQPGEDLTTQGAQLMQNALGITQRAQRPLGEFLKAYYQEHGARYSPQNFSDKAPGSEWAYSNLASSLSAFLIEAATGQSFADYTRENIFLPLGMVHTTYETPTDNSDLIASLYWDKDTPLPRYGNDSYPDGSVYTSNEDLANYLLDMMRGYRGDSQQLFSTNAYAELFTPRLPNGMPHPAVADNQGIFWFWQGDKLRHDGSDPGTTCLLEFNTSQNTGYFILSNADASSDEHEQQFFQTTGRIKAAIDTFLELQ